MPSRVSKSLSFTTLAGEFRRRDYAAIPVNPGVADVEGVRCYANVQDIEPPVDRAVLVASLALRVLPSAAHRARLVSRSLPRAC